MGRTLAEKTWEEQFEHFSEVWDKWCERNQLEAPIASFKNSPRDRAWNGKCVIVAQRDEFFGGEHSKDYVSPVLNNPTWGTVMKHFNKAIQTTGDRHHCFLEGIGEMTGGRKVVNRDLPEDVTVLTFWTGS